MYFSIVVSFQALEFAFRMFYMDKQLIYSKHLL
jgi:hypothetical protein